MHSSVQGNLMPSFIFAWALHLIVSWIPPPELFTDLSPLIPLRSLAWFPALIVSPRMATGLLSVLPTLPSVKIDSSTLKGPWTWLRRHYIFTFSEANWKRALASIMREAAICRAISNTWSLVTSGSHVHFHITYYSCWQWHEHHLCPSLLWNYSSCYICIMYCYLMY